MKKILSVMAGLFTAFLTMMVFESLNSFLFPFPQDFDMTDVQALQAFTKSLPWTAYILVVLGWAGGSFLAGFVTGKLSKSQSSTLPFALSLLLALFGVANFSMIGHPMWMIVTGVLLFASLPFMGFKLSHPTLNKNNE